MDGHLNVLLECNIRHNVLSQRNRSDRRRCASSDLQGAYHEQEFINSVSSDFLQIHCLDNMYPVIHKEDDVDRESCARRLFQSDCVRTHILGAPGHKPFCALFHEPRAAVVMRCVFDGLVEVLYPSGPDETASPFSIWVPCPSAARSRATESIL